MDCRKDESEEQIVQLIGSCQRRLFLYLLGLLCSRDLVEDALQETNAVLWRKRSEYVPGTNFFAWACNVAFYEACKARKKRRRKVPVFSDVFLQGVMPELAAAAEAADPMLAALQDCVSRLSLHDRELIQRRYDDGATVRSVAANVGRSADSVYKSLSRIHRDLFDCITEKLNEDERP